ncbi:MAG: hypothetical protein PHV32_17080 [Eubacteriales bacterium]|nr:hypothetical protein [Eubacteriales bacterium]
MKLIKILKDKSGSGTPLILAIVLVCIILSTTAFEYARLIIVAQGVRDSVQSAVIDVATENWDEAYAGLREGYSGGYALSGSRWYRNVTSGNIYGRLKEVLGLKYQSGKYIKCSGESTEYTLSGLTISVANAPLAPSDPNSISQLTVTGYITVEVPLSFGWGHLPSMTIRMKFKSVYVPKF